MERNKKSSATKESPSEKIQLSAFTNQLKLDKLSKSELQNLILELTEHQTLLETQIKGLKSINQLSQLSEEKYHLALMTSQDAFFLVTLDEWKFININDAFIELFGYDLKSVIGKTDLELNLFADLADREFVLKELAHKGFVKNRVTKGKRSDGEIVWLSISINIWDHEREKLIVGSIKDITSEKKIETSLIEEKERLQNILQGTNVGTWEWNLTTGETIYNERWAEILGYTLQEISPTSIDTWRQFVHPDDYEQALKKWQSHINHDSPFYEFEARMKHKLGHWVWVLDRGRVNKWFPEGTPLKMSGTHQDISKRKTFELANIERVKELNLLYSASEILSNKNLNIENALQKIVDILPESFQYPEDTQAIIQIKDKDYKTANFEVSPWKICTHISVNSVEIGFLKIYYLSEHPESDEGPFLKEERNLINNLGIQISEYLELKYIENEQIALRNNLLKAEKAAKMGFWEMDLLNNRLYSSEGSLDILGLDKQVSFQEIQNLRLSKVNALSDNYLTDLAHQSKQFEATVKFKRANDNAIIDIHTKAEFDADRNVIFGINQDITERKKIEEELEFTKAQLELSIDAGQIGTFIFELKTDYQLSEVSTFRNQRHDQIFGYPENLKNWTIETYFEHVHADDLNFVKSAFAELFTKAQSDIEFRIVWPDGSIHWILMKYKIYKNPVSELTKLAGSVIDISKIKESEVRMLEMEELFSTTFYKNPITMAISEPFTGIIIDVNEKFLALSGYKKEEVIGKNTEIMHFFRHESDVSFVRTSLAQNPTIENYECEFLSKSGDILIGLVSINLFKYKNQVCQLTSILNITERKKAQVALQLSEEKFKTAFMTIPNAFYLGELDSGKLLDCNHGFTELFGFSREESIGKTTLELGFFDNPAIRKNMVKEMRLNGYIRDKEFTVATKNGESKRVVLSSRIYNHNGTDFFISSAADITESYKLKEILRQNEEKFRLSFMTANDGFYLSKIENAELIDFNSAFSSIFGYTRDEMLGKTTLELGLYFNTEDRDKFINEIKNKGKVNQVEICGRKKDGTLISISLSANLITIENIPCTIGIIRDITEQKITQLKLKEYHEKLTQAMQTADLAWWEMDLESGSVHFDQLKAEMLGYPPEHFKHYTDFTSLFHPEDADKAYEAMYQHVMGVLPKYEIEYRIKTSSGDYMWFYDIGAINNWDSNGKPLTVSALVKNIDDRKKAEAKIEASQQYIRSIIDNSPMPLAIYVDNNNITYINKSLTDIMGYTLDDISTLENWWPKAYPDPIYREKIYKDWNSTIDQLKDNGEPITPVQVKIVCKDGTEKYFVVSANLTSSDVENEIMVQFQEITKQIEVQIELSESEEKYRLLNENAGIGIGYYKLDGTIINYNLVAAQNMGGVPEDFRGKSIYDLFPRENADIYMKRLKIAAISNKTEHFEDKVHLSAGHKHFSSSFTKIVNSKGEISGIQIISFDTTERLHSLEIIQSKNLEFRKLSSNIPDLIFQFTRRKDGTYCVPIASVGIKNIFGCTPEEVIDDFTPIAKVIYQEDFEYVLNAIEASAAQLSTFDIEFRVQIPGKEIQWIHSKSKPEITYDGEITWYGFNTDITAKKKAEEKLNKLNRLYNFIRKVNELIVYTTDEDVLYQEACNIAVQYGKFRMAWIGMTALDSDQILPTAIAGHEENYLTEVMIHSGSDSAEGRGPSGTALRNGKISFTNDIEYDPVMKPWKKAAMQRGYYSSIALPIIKNNEVIAIFTLYAPTKNFFNKEEITLLEGVAKNISFSAENIEKERIRKTLNEKLALDEAQIRKLSLAIEQSPVTTVITDLDGRIVFVNPKFTEVTGYSKEEAIGQNPHILSTGHTTKTEYRKLWHTIKNGKNWKGTFLNKKKNGELFWESAVISPVKNETGEIINFLAVKEDITLFKKSEEERSILLADLIKHNKNLEQFAYIVSHNLRTPVAKIIGISQLFNLKNIDKEQKAMYNTQLLKSVEKLDDVIKDLNSILQVKNQVNKEEWLDFEVLVKDAVDSIRQTVIEEHVTFKLDFKSAEKLYGIKSYLYSIFLNLITNSIKYRKGDLDPVIEIRSFLQNDEIVVLFKDNGIGIDLGVHGQNVFGLYKRFHTDYAEGKGMGLFMVKTQVEALGGTISLDSEPNIGTQFTLTFKNKI